ncbi:MAG: hypothetical protein LBU32_05795 [Clostridiales bacterium]|nr:hypothetical protein [Clostridiales bacterium]
MARAIKRGTARRSDGGSAERLGHFAETGGAAHGKSCKNCRKPLKIAGRPDFMAFAGEKLGHWEIGSAAGKKSDKSAVPAIVERKASSQIAAEPGGSGAADAAAGQVAGSFGEAAPQSAPSISAIPAPASRRGRASAAAGFRAASRKRGEARAACPRS